MDDAREYVVMWRRAAGNGEVGTSWTETAVFPASAQLRDIEAWIIRAKRYVEADRANLGDGDGDVIIQIAQRPEVQP